MSPSRIQNHLAFYIVPWLTALACLLASVPPLREPVLNATFIWLLSTTVILGLPHGAADWWIMRRAAGPRWRPWGRAGLLAAYVSVALLMLSVWVWRWDVATLVFLALTVWHFGTADASVLLPGHSRLRDPAWWLFAVGRGLLVILTPIACHPADSWSFLEFSTPMGLSNLPGRALWPFSISSPTVFVRVIWTFACAGSILQLIGLFLKPDPRTRPWNLAEIAELIVLFSFAHPLLAFTGYFVAFHSWRHFLRLRPLFGPPTPQSLWLRAVRFHLRTLPVAALSLLGGVLIYALWPKMVGYLIMSYLMLLSILTAPHAIVIGWLDWKNPAGFQSDATGDPGD